MWLILYSSYASIVLIPFVLVQETMNICATRHLDATERYFHHPKQAMERYLRSVGTSHCTSNHEMTLIYCGQVSRHVDIMDAYEDAWPAQAYARIWLNWGTKARVGFCLFTLLLTIDLISHLQHERARRRTTSTVRGTNPPRSTLSQKRTSPAQSKGNQTKSNHGKENDIPSGQTPAPEVCHVCDAS